MLNALTTNELFYINKTFYKTKIGNRITRLWGVKNWDYNYKVVNCPISYLFTNQSDT